MENVFVLWALVSFGSCFNEGGTFLLKLFPVKDFIAVLKVTVGIMFQYIFHLHEQQGHIKP